MQFNEEYFNSEEFQELLDSYETAIASGSQPFMDADDFVDIADYYSMVGDADKASDVVKIALQLYPHATLPNVFKARGALQDGDIEAAQRFAKNIESKDDPDYHYLVAEIMIAQGRIDDGDRYLRDYSRSVDADEYQDFVKDCANLYVDYGISDKAYEWMMRSKGDNSDDFKELMARTLFGLGKYKDSERIFNELIDHNPYSKRYWNALASAQFLNEEYNASVTSSEYVLAIDPADPEGLLSKANALLRLGNYEEAMDYYQRYDRIVPNDEFSLLNQGICLINLGRLEEALPLLEKVATMPTSEPTVLPQVYQELAFCYSNKGDIDKALEMLDRTQELPCDHIDMMVVRGHILLENGLSVEAEAAYKQAMHLSNNSPAVILRIIVSIYDNHFVTISYQMFKVFFKVVSAHIPDFKNGYAYMALCCYDLDKGDEFLSYLKKAVDANPQEAQLVLSELFPEGMEVTDYYPYMEKRLKN